eukprot:TRINITY_DN80772_c0_g1_i1.p1 TRINITY_DN80772_c0_g1~~TRINITY_DN80772_c0_g1_i1.p1  ORF type:complete len:585 (-),score=120.36 TRINITY_DN80772_c0_g1_i1:99-1853(-)
MEPCTKRARMAPRVIPVSSGPCVWWVRNDLRVQDNPVVRVVVGAALCDQREFCAVFCFDPRFLDQSPYGRVTDPEFTKSIWSRKSVNFQSRKTNALRARFWIQCVLKLRDDMARRGSKLLICYGKPEEVLPGLPEGSEVKCQPEPVSIEQTDVEQFVSEALRKKGSKLRKDPGAMSLYHPDDLPFDIKDRPDNYSALCRALGWCDLWTSTDRFDWATPVRGTVPAPSVFPPVPKGLDLPGLISEEVLADETKFLRHLGYSDEEIKEAQAQPIPEGGEDAARQELEEWIAKSNEAPALQDTKLPAATYADLPCAGQAGPQAGVDPMQWLNLTTPDGGMRFSHYLAVGCISARELFGRSQETPFFAMVAHRLMWREFHRLYAIKYGRRIAWLQGPAKVKRSWKDDPEVAEAWKKGKTGVPYIDACQRELLQTGWLAYKGRKTSAHFFIFDLWMDWRIGAFHFEEVLLDYDFAMNYGNWAVVAKIGNGGASAWDGSREFDPQFWDLRFKLSAEQKNDPSGEYIRKWVPELRNVEARFIHTPWEMSDEDMQASSCVLGKEYPKSLVGPLDLRQCEPDWKESEMDQKMA